MKTLRRKLLSWVKVKCYDYGTPFGGGNLSGIKRILWQI